MTDEQRKRLTEYLGECLHKTILDSPAPQLFNGWCPDCDAEAKWRTFTTDADMMALFRKIVDAKDELKFSDYTFEIGITDSDSLKNHPTFESWLFYDPSRFCCLVAQWLEEKK